MGYSGYPPQGFWGGATYIGSGAVFPASPAAGWCFYRTDLREYYIYDGTNWVPWRTRGYTIVVAASNSLDPTLADPAFRCDGTADQAEINAAITALGATGGAVILLDGTYEITAPVTLASNVALVGQGAGTVLRIPDGHDEDLNVVYAATQDHVLVANLKIDGNKANQTAGAMRGIYFDTVTHSKIVDCWVEDTYTGGGGMYLTGSSNNIIAGNTARGNDGTGITLFTGSDNNTVIGNTCQGNGSNGITVYTNAGNTVSGNTCQGNTAAGITVYTSTDNTVSGNTCNGNGVNGINIFASAHRNTVTGNTCKENANNGITVANSQASTFTGNTCQGNSIGIYLETSTDNTVSGNTCQGNTVIGIDLTTSSDNNTITGNTCQGNTGSHGITVAASSSNNTITGNTCQGNGACGIRLESTSNNNTVTGNTCQGNGEDGISLMLVASNNTVTGNTCQGNGFHGIRLAGSNNNTVSGNTCLENSQTTDNTYENIYLEDSDYNLIVGNVCRKGGLANRPEYGINISNDACDRNCLIGNDLYDSGLTGDLNDVPTTNPTLKHDNRDLAGTGWLPEV